jgi:hypothetical protein
MLCRATQSNRVILTPTLMLRSQMLPVSCLSFVAMSTSQIPLFSQKEGFSKGSLDSRERSPFILIFLPYIFSLRDKWPPYPNVCSRSRKPSAPLRRSLTHSIRLSPRAQHSKPRFVFRQTAAATRSLPGRWRATATDPTGLQRVHAQAGESTS